MNIHGLTPGRPTEISYEEEREIAHAFVYLAKAGAPVGRRHLVLVVKSYLDNIGRTTRFLDNKPGHEWVLKFEERHADLLTRRRPELLTTSRAKSLTKDVAKCFFDMWEQVLDENNLRDAPHRIFNCDETGLNTDPTKCKVYTKKGSKDVYMETPNCGKVMYTVLFCASATGSFMPPLVVYKGKVFMDAWASNGPRNAAYSVSESGYMHDANFEQWFINVFVAETKTYEKPVVLLFDGHNSHLTYMTVKTAIDNQVVLVCLPPHTSHALQPLDVGVFKAVKSKWRKILEDYFNAARVQKRAQKFHSVDKSKFPRLLAKLWPQLAADHVVNGFKKSGLVPVNRAAIASKIIEETSSSDSNAPTPRKSLKKAIFDMLSPEEANTEKRGPRKRVQHKTGEVLTTEIVAQRLQQEAAERAAKKAGKVGKKTGRKVGRPRKRQTKQTKQTKRSLAAFFSDKGNSSGGESAEKEESKTVTESDDSWSGILQELEVQPVKNLDPVPSTSGFRRREKWETKTLSPPPSAGGDSGDSSDQADHSVDQEERDEERDKERDEERDDGQGQLVDCKELQEMCSYVIVNYEGSYFPGLVTKIKKTSIMVSTMTKCGPDHWKWPQKKDECEYIPSEIVEIINAPEIANNRGAMHVPETVKYWN